MRKSILFLSALIFLFACSKNEDAKIEDQPLKSSLNLKFDKSAKPILFEITSTGCPGCGGWGKPTFNDFIQKYPDQIAPIAVHIKYNDPMITVHSNAIDNNNYGQKYTPQIWVNDTNGVSLSVNSINTAASIAKIDRLILNALGSNVPKLDAGFEISGNKMLVKFGVKMNGELAAGDYYLSCFLMGNGLVYEQRNYANNPATHNDYIIDAAFDSTFGKHINYYGNGELLSEFLTDFNIEANAAPGKYHLRLVLWRKLNNRYQPVCGF